MTVREALPAAARVRLESLFNDHLRAVYGFCRSRLPEADAEDVTGDVFRSAAEQLRADPSRELNRSWLLTAARNRIIDRWRYRDRWAGRLEVLRRDVDETVGPISGDAGDRVLEALDCLAHDHRVVLLLRYVDGCSAREIGDAMGRSVTAVDSLLARARRGFTEAYEEVAS